MSYYEKVESVLRDRGLIHRLDTSHRVAEKGMHYFSHWGCAMQGCDCEAERAKARMILREVRRQAEETSRYAEISSCTTLKNLLESKMKSTAWHN